MSKIVTLALAAAALLFAGASAWAHSCETYPGSQIYTDQNCGNPYDDSARPSAAQPPQTDSGLRERLRNALSNGAGAGAPDQQTADQINQRVLDARARVDAALADPNAPGAAARYDAALGDLRAAYGDAAAAYPDKAALFQDLEAQDVASASQRADAAGLNAPPAAAAAAPPAQTGPANVTAVGSTVYVCDGAIAGADNVSCREIAADGQCTGVILADGGIGWRDSIATPCDPNDMSQRAAFLQQNADAAGAVGQAPPGFAMDGAGTEAEIARLSEPLPGRAVDGGEESDWDDDLADDDTPPSIETARAATPIDLSTMQAPSSDAGNDDDSSPDLDDAIDTLNAASALLGAASSLAGSGARTAPSFSVPQPTFRAPSSPPPQFHSAPAPARSGNSDITGLGQ